MELSMLDFVPYEIRGFYPHMAPTDTLIWTRFIAANPDMFSVVAYDVPVGAGADFNTVVNPATGGDVKKLYQRKIDVVAVQKNLIFVIEVKPRASTSTIGQVKGYEKLFVRDYAPIQPVQAFIVTDQLLPEMEFLTANERVLISVV